MRSYNATGAHANSNLCSTWRNNVGHSGSLLHCDANTSTGPSRQRPAICRCPANASRDASVSSPRRVFQGSQSTADSKHCRDRYAPAHVCDASGATRVDPGADDQLHSERGCRAEQPSRLERSLHHSQRCDVSHASGASCRSCSKNDSSGEPIQNRAVATKPIH